ncbi:hypothetical protein ACFFRR_010856 [Megaselia abdita]
MKDTYNLRSRSPMGNSSPISSSPRLARRKGYEHNPLSIDPRGEHEQFYHSENDDEDFYQLSSRLKTANETRDEISGPEIPLRSKPIENHKLFRTKLSSQMYAFGGLVLVLFCWVYAKNCPEFQPPLSTVKTCKFQKLQQEYSEQDKYLWMSLETGLENVINKKTYSPAIYLFIYRKHTSKEMVLINKIINRASECFDPSLKLGRMNEDFTSEAALEDYGTAIEKYKTLITEGNVLLLVGLNDIPATAARALHSICDVHNPLLNRVVVFLTLEVQSIEGKPIEIAENTLLNLWKRKIKDSELFPLVSRVTDQVVVVKR